LIGGPNDNNLAGAVWALTEPIPPTVETGEASFVSQTQASLNATVNPNGQTVSACHFEYGTSTSYGSSAPCSSSPGSGYGPVAVSTSLTGLEANTTYHFRIVSANPSGTSKGADQTFATNPNAAVAVRGSGSSSGTGGVLSSVEGKVSPLRMELASASLATSESGIVSIKVSCPPGEISCTGSVTLQSLTTLVAGALGHSTKHKGAILMLATGTFSVPGGQLAIIKLHLSRMARKLLVRSHRLRARARIIGHNLPGHASYSYQETVVLRLSGEDRRPQRRHG
jgi:hypothetical protein